MSQGGLPVTKPVSVWNKPLEADWRGLFKALAKGGKDAVLLRWEELPGTGVDLLSSIGVQTGHGERAYLLIRRALTAAIHELVGESIPRFERFEDDAEGVVEGFDWSVEESELRIDRRFFDRPTRLGLLDPLKDRLFDLLVALGLEEPRARVASHRLGTYFTFHLAREWRDHPSAYAPLKEALDGPFATAAEREQGWILYDRWLQKRTEESVFGESFSIQDVYIPLRAYWERPDDKDSGTSAGARPMQLDRSRPRTSPDPDRPDRVHAGEEGPPAAKVRRVAVDLHEEIESWLEQSKHPKAIRLLSGGPGSGKSTFARMLSAKVSGEGGRRVLYVPLHQLNVHGDLVSSLGRFVEEDRFLTGNPLDPKAGEDRLFLVLDGLDELEMQGKVGAEVASNFVEEVRRTVERRNGQGADIRVLITGRPVATDPQQTRFRLAGQLLHALPYQVSQQVQKRYENHEILKEDQRHSWWRRYQECVGQESQGLPEQLDRDDLAEVTRQPLLNYLLALSYQRGRIDFSRETSLNQIYEDLLDAVYERQWEKSGTYRAVAGLEQGKFHRVLEEIAVAAWHGNGRTASMGEIQDRFTRMGLDKVLESFAKDAEAGVNRLLLAFYFRHAGQTGAGDPTFEFTHKSFGEYLTSRRLVGMIGTLSQQLDENKRDFDHGWDTARALEKWAELTGPMALEENRLAFLRREVALRDQKQVLQWQKHLANLLSSELESGLPIDRVKTAMSYQQMTIWAKNAEETLLASLNACARKSKTVSEVRWPTSTSFGDLLCRLRGQRSGPSLVLGCLSYLEASGCDLDLADLYLADLSFSRFVNSRFYLTILHQANLEGANLRGANLRGANLQGTQFQSAQFQGAQLQKAQFQEARLQRAQLQEAQLQEAQLQGAQVEGAQLQGARLQRAQLQRAQLHKVQFQEADLEEADLQGAQLWGADLRGVCLWRADLRGADLRRADLRRADLREVDLREAILEEALFAPMDLAERLFGAKLLPQQLNALDLPPAEKEPVRKVVRIIKEIDERISPS